MTQVHIKTNINGDNLEFLCGPEETLLDVLRDKLQLTGTKEGCGTGDCGACSITSVSYTHLTLPTILLV